MFKRLTAFFKDKHGRIAIWQWPNPPLYGWTIFGLASLVLSGKFQAGSVALSQASLFTWAYLELVDGVSYARRALGLVVLVVIVVGLFI